MSVVIVYDHIMQTCEKVINKADDAVKKIGHDGEASMKNEVPVKTGNLKNQTSFNSTGRAKGEWASNTPYARYVNDGTSRMPARPYFTHGIEHARHSLESVIRTLFNGVT
jgi:HK97 gp10 family phage protein